MLEHFARATIQGYHSIRKINWILLRDHFWVGIISGTVQFSLNIQIQSTPDNSNLQGKQKKVRVIKGYQLDVRLFFSL